MNPKKLKEKDRRRARKLAEEAWEAVEANNLDLAEKIIRRAVAAQEDNPILWNDQGMILELRGKESDAGEAYRTALSLAPTYAEPLDRLAALYARQGFAGQAVTLQTQAVKHAPDNPIFADRLEAYRALAGEKIASVVGEITFVPADRPQHTGPIVGNNNWSRRLQELEWHEIANMLTRDGCVHIPGIVDATTCSTLRLMYGADELFGKTVVMDRPEFGLGEYRYFRAPIPSEVDSLRCAFFPHVSEIANGWQQLLGEPEKYPKDWEGFRDKCREAGQTTPTPILLRYRAGGFNALHRDLRRGVFSASNGSRTKPPCQFRRRARRRLSRRRVSILRCSGCEEIASTETGRESRRRDTLLHARPIGVSGRCLWAATGEAWCCANYGRNALCTRRAVS